MNIWSKLVEVNVGRYDRWARLLVGVALAVVALWVPTAWGLLGIYPFVTGLFGTSPLYMALGVNTRPAPHTVKAPRPLPPMSRASAPVVRPPS